MHEINTKFPVVCLCQQMLSIITLCLYISNVQGTQGDWRCDDVVIPNGSIQRDVGMVTFYSDYSLCYDDSYYYDLIIDSDLKLVGIYRGMQDEDFEMTRMKFNCNNIFSDDG